MTEYYGSRARGLSAFRYPYTFCVYMLICPRCKDTASDATPAVSENCQTSFSYFGFTQVTLSGAVGAFGFTRTLLAGMPTFT